MRFISILGAACVVSITVAAPAATAGGPARDRFIGSAREDVGNNTASLPTYTAIVDGAPVTYVVTEASSRSLARRLRVTWAPKLANARGTAAVQGGVWRTGRLHLEATVDFSPERVVVPGPGGFPPATAEPGSVGESGYSPLVELPDGSVINAPQIANASGRHDKIVALGHSRARFKETEGFYEGHEVYYVSFDVSDPGVAALEASTYAPNLNAAPGLGSDDRQTSARAGIVPFVNGQTGIDNENRQGLNSALLGEGDPLNIVQEIPEGGSNERRYSPLWDVHATAWTDAAAADGRNVRQTDFADVAELADDGAVTGPGGSAWGAIGVIVNCPLISIED